MRIWLLGTALAATLVVGAPVQAQDYGQQYVTPGYWGYSPNYYPPTPYGYGSAPVYGGPSTSSFYFDRSGYNYTPAPQSYGYQSYDYRSYGYAPQGFAPQYLHPQTSWYGGYHGSTSRYWNR